MKQHDASLVTIINHLADVMVYEQYDFDEFLKKLIKVISDIVPVDSCFIYFYDKDKKQFTLVASKKPHKEELGKVTLQKGEGITGWAADHLKIVVIPKEAYKDPRFKYVKELPEDKFESFLSVPILNERGVIGVINLQDRKPYNFSKEEIKTIESLVKIIASAFVKVLLTRKVNHLENKLEERQLVEKAKGLLMKIKKITEDEAYHFIRKESMAKRKSMKDIAEAVLLVYK